MSVTSPFATTAIQISFQSLVLDAVGEYTARSVAANPLDARNLHLVKQPDGDFAVPAPAPFTVSGLSAARSTFSVQSALYGLSLGG